MSIRFMIREINLIYVLSIRDSCYFWCYLFTHGLLRLFFSDSLLQRSFSFKKTNEWNSRSCFDTIWDHNFWILVWARYLRDTRSPRNPKEKHFCGNLFLNILTNYLQNGCDGTLIIYYLSVISAETVIFWNSNIL